MGYDSQMEADRERKAVTDEGARAEQSYGRRVGSGARRQFHIPASQQTLSNHTMQGVMAGIHAVGEVIQRTPTRQSVTLSVGQTRRRQFTVAGRTLAAAGAELAARDEWGRGGAESIHYSYHASAASAVDRLAISAVAFTDLPVWATLAHQPRAVQREWLRMLAALTRHENRHVSIAREKLGEMRDAMRGKPEDELNSTYEGELAALQAAQQAYDDDTDHGQDEGVSLDLSVAEPSK